MNRQTNCFFLNLSLLLIVLTFATLTSITFAQPIKEIDLKPAKPKSTKRVIGVARFSEDTSTSSPQQSIIKSIKHEIENDPQLKGSVDIIELPIRITGATQEEQEKQAEQAGRGDTASIVIWGEIATSTDKGETLQSRVTVLKPQEVESYGIALPIGFLQSLPALPILTHQKTTQISSQSLKQPTLLLTFVHAFLLLETGKLESLERTIPLLNDLLEVERAAQNWPGYAHIQRILGICYRNNIQEKDFRRAIDLFQESSRFFQNKKNNLQYGIIQNDLGLTYQMLAALRSEPDQNLNLSIKAFNEAAQAANDSQKKSNHAIAKNNAGLSYQARASWGIEPEKNIGLAIKTFEEADNTWKGQKDVANSALAQYNIGMLYQARASWGIESVPSLATSIKKLEEVASLWKDQKNASSAGSYAMARSGLGAGFQALASWGIEPKKNLLLAIDTLTDAARLLKEQQNKIGYATTVANLGLSYQLLATRNIDSAENFVLSINALQEAATLWKEQNNKAGFSMAKNNLGVAYLGLAQKNIDSEKNKNLSEQSFKEAQPKASVPQ